ncbi:protein V57 [Equid alphaherpesvirus 1]|uniref:Protein V57 n=1 Tax=Equid alphaherpesvirus 1 TaxID=10326 RepID=L8AYH9_9ALPH|nr:protein V57 [Equid alphaherpesvirus 1]
MDVFGRGRAATADDYRRFLERNSRAATKLAAATTPTHTASSRQQPEVSARPRHRSLSSRRNSVPHYDPHAGAGGDGQLALSEMPSGTLGVLAMAAQRRKSIGRPDTPVNAAMGSALRSSQRPRGDVRNPRGEGQTQRGGSRGEANHAQRRQSVTQSTAARQTQPHQGRPRPRRNTRRHM